MTYSIGKAFFPLSGTLRRAAGALLLAGLCACSTSNTREAAPVARADAVGPQDTGTFPNLNIAPKNAAPQFTGEQTSAKLAQLKADQAAAQRGAGAKGAAAVSTAELNSLAANRGQDTLKQIEGAQSAPKCDPALDPTCK